MTIQELKHKIESDWEVELSTSSRRLEYVYLRAIYVHLCYKHFNITLEKIGATINRDHSTVLHCINKTIPVIEFVDSKYKNYLNDLDAYLSSPKYKVSKIYTEIDELQERINELQNRLNQLQQYDIPR